MKIVVTGALGHIGSYAVRELASVYPGAEIVMIDNMLTQRYCSLFNLPPDRSFRFIEEDVLKCDLPKIFEKADIVLHLAAITDAARSFDNKEEVENVNYNATVKVSNACHASGAPMIHLSSTSVYGTQKEVVDEDCSPEELKPQSPYAITKLKEEDYLKEMSEKDDFRFITCRFGTICGISPGMRFHTAVNKFSWQAVMGQPLTVWRTALHQKRPYLTLYDAVEAIKFIINKDIYDCRVYNVLTDNLTVDAIITMIKSRKPDLEVGYVDTKIMNQLSYDVSNARFAKKGFKVKGSIENSISETINLLENAGKKDGR